jgi:hypothetical protein
MSALNCPIVGDEMYAGTAEAQTGGEQGVGEGGHALGAAGEGGGGGEVMGFSGVKRLAGDMESRTEKEDGGEGEGEGEGGGGVDQHGSKWLAR